MSVGLTVFSEEMPATWVYIPRSRYFAVSRGLALVPGQAASRSPRVSPVRGVGAASVCIPESENKPQHLRGRI